MAKALFPFFCFYSPAAARVVGADVAGVAVAALRAAIRNGQGLEIAHQQIRWGEHDLAFSVRIGRLGDLVIDIDIGDANLRDRIVLEADLRREARKVKGIRGDERDKRGR